MSFVLFAGWFAGATVPVAQYPTFALTGLFSFFGSTSVAMPMLMDLHRIPVDLFQLYLAIDVVTRRFAVLLTTTNNLVLTLLGACAVTGHLTPRWGRILRNAVLTLVFAAVTLATVRVFFTVALDNPYHKDKIVANMHFMRREGPATVLKSLPPQPPSDVQQPVFKRIHARGMLRVGYLPDNRAGRSVPRGQSW